MPAEAIDEVAAGYFAWIKMPGGITREQAYEDAIIYGYDRSEIMRRLDEMLAGTTITMGKHRMFAPGQRLSRIIGSRRRREEGGVLGLGILSRKHGGTEAPDPPLCSLESMKFNERVQHMLGLPHSVRILSIEGDIEGIERHLRIIEKSCGIKFRKAWETIERAKGWIDKGDKTTAILAMDHIGRDAQGDIVEQFE